MSPVRSRRMVACLAVAAAASLAQCAEAGEPMTHLRQITFGPKHHFFGYIGHARTIPWNASGRYVLALKSTFQDRMPTAADAAEIVLLDAQRDYAERTVERTRAWNFQQGTMFYWNPTAAQTEFVFNDRDPHGGAVFAVLYDLAAGKRRREYRFDGVPVGNSGVAPPGGKFAAINYGRLARLRPVTGYPDALDPTAGVNHPADDGVWVVDMAAGSRRLLVSYADLAEAIRPTRSDIDQVELFINHTLWSPDGKRLFFFCRGDFGNPGRRVDVPFVADVDGGKLEQLARHIGGHPEWLDARRMIGRWDRRQGIYDLQRQAFVGALGDADTFDDPGGDVALSPDGRWLVNGSSLGAENRYTFYRLSDGRTRQGGPLARGAFRSGDLRIDGAPAWNRTSTAVLTTAIAPDVSGTRQLFLIELDPGE